MNIVWYTKMTKLLNIYFQPKEKQDLTVYERKVVSSSVQATDTSRVDTCVQDVSVNAQHFGITKILNIGSSILHWGVLWNHVK